MKDIKDTIKDIKKKLKDKYKNEHQIPQIKKVVIHRGMGEAVNNSAIIEKTYQLFYAISGQKPVLTRAKKSISNFKVREGQVIGCKVTLRSKKMLDFLSNLLYLSLPKVRDFRGISRKGCDNFGNFSFGIKDDSIFPQSPTDLGHIKGMDITICTTAKNNEDLLFILEHIGVPFEITKN